MGVEPVGRPRTVRSPAELFSRIRLSTTSATWRSTSRAFLKASVGTLVWRMYCAAGFWDAELFGEGIPGRDLNSHVVTVVPLVPVG